MSEENVSELSHYDVYILSIDELKDSWLFANKEYQQGRHKIVFENTPYTDYYLKRISKYRDSLKNDYELVKMFRNNVNQQALGKFEKEEFDSEEEFLIDVEELLKKMVWPMEK